jgi:hypothetical protein
MITCDEYGIAYNSSQTFEGIAKILLEEKTMLIAWTDKAMTHLDLLLSLNPYTENPRQDDPLAEYLGMSTQPFQGGVKSSDLFVSVMRKGCFGFERRGNDLHPAYIGEKLDLGEENETTIKLAELINEVRRYL